MRYLNTSKKLIFLSLFLFQVVNLQGTPATLMVPVLSPCLRAEQLHITIDTHTGMIRCHVPKHLDCPLMAAMQSALNRDRNKLPAILTELRYWITFQRCQKTLQHLPATAVENLCFLEKPEHPILQQGRQRIYVKLHHYTNVVLVNARILKTIYVNFWRRELI